MKKFQFVVAIVCVVVGIVIGFAIEHSTVRAQSEPVQGPWEIYHGSFGQQSFYAIKQNRSTGETWVLSATRGAADDLWLKLPEEVKQPKK
jgi:hypothetical protein